MPSARLALLILTGINLLNYVDRYVVAALVQRLGEAAPVGLGLSDAQSGWLASGFIVVYLATSPLFGLLADRRSRPHLIAAGVALWALASGASAFASGFVALLAARSLVGVGEAAYGTAAPALLADCFPRARRGQVFAVFYAAIPLGAALGFAVGGAVAERFGWRSAFLVVAAPGLLFAAAAALLPDPPRGAGETAVPVAPRRALADLAEYVRLFTRPSYAYAVLGYAAYTFALGALAFWTPAFLQRVHGLSPTSATVAFGTGLAVTGVLGTLLGGWLADRLRAHLAHADMWVCAASMWLACPLVAVAILADSPTFYVPAIAGAEILLFLSTGPVNTAIVEAVDPGTRARAMAASIVAIHLLGDVPSPPLIGWIAEQHSLRAAMLLVPVAVGMAGVAWLRAATLPAVEPRT
ncbi:MAG TPA: MFS transporter [Candidatus Dormibacteraeota bacterium]|nr:MFS transporter [Candidatus Dormibacteraeota bacterium]